MNDDKTIKMFFGVTILLYFRVFVLLFQKGALIIGIVPQTIPFLFKACKKSPGIYLISEVAGLQSKSAN